jgi:signal peptide peptidase SppA
MNMLMRIADRALNRPLLITPDKAEVIISVLSGRIGVSSPEASRFEGDSLDRDENGNLQIITNNDGQRQIKKKPYNVSGSTAIITITGTLVNRGAWIGANSGLTSYEGIQHQIKTAAADPAVKSIILDMHTPGGEAVGAFETGEIVRQAAKSKTVIALVNGMSASAGYAIASGATEIVTTQTGVSGSIGVVLLHADYSRALANEGITPTLIFAGDHKVDGNPFSPLPDSVRADLQAEVNAFYDLFLLTVAKGRGSRLSAAAARKTGARTFIGQSAVDLGLADRVGSFESVLADLSRATGRSTVQNGRPKMDNMNNAPAAEENAGIPKATHDAAVKQARTEGHATGHAEGLKAGAIAERGRLDAIRNAEGIKGSPARLAAALDLAAESPDMAADKVVAFAVKNVPAEAASASLSERGNQPDSLAQINSGLPQGNSGGMSWADFRSKRAASR